MEGKGREGKVERFMDLDVWKKGIEIADLTHELIQDFPEPVIWGLGTQMQRSSVSVPSNIAEGSERQYTPEYFQFCHIALGSCAELATQLLIARRRKFILQEQSDILGKMMNHERRMLKNMVKSLRTGIKN